VDGEAGHAILDGITEEDLDGVRKEPYYYLGDSKSPQGRNMLAVTEENSMGQSLSV
jgi:hypothetical protein